MGDGADTGMTAFAPRVREEPGVCCDTCAFCYSADHADRTRKAYLCGRPLTHREDGRLWLPVVAINEVCDYWSPRNQLPGRSTFSERCDECGQEISARSKRRARELLIDHKIGVHEPGPIDQLREAR